jgi:hypothetical protein
VPLSVEIVMSSSVSTENHALGHGLSPPSGDGVLNPGGGPLLPPFNATAASDPVSPKTTINVGAFDVSLLSSSSYPSSLSAAISPAPVVSFSNLANGSSAATSSSSVSSAAPASASPALLSGAASGASASSGATSGPSADSVTRPVATISSGASASSPPNGAPSAHAGSAPARGVTHWLPQYTLLHAYVPGSMSAQISSFDLIAYLFQTALMMTFHLRELFEASVTHFDIPDEHKLLFTTLISSSLYKATVDQYDNSPFGVYASERVFWGQFLCPIGNPSNAYHYIANGLYGRGTTEAEEALRSFRELEDEILRKACRGDRPSERQKRNAATLSIANITAMPAIYSFFDARAGRPSSAHPMHLPFNWPSETLSKSQSVNLVQFFSPRGASVFSINWASRFFAGRGASKLFEPANLSSDDLREAISHHFPPQFLENMATSSRTMTISPPDPRKKSFARGPLPPPRGALKLACATLNSPEFPISDCLSPLAAASDLPFGQQRPRSFSDAFTGSTSAADAPFGQQRSRSFRDAFPGSTSAGDAPQAPPRSFLEAATGRSSGGGAPYHGGNRASPSAPEYLSPSSAACAPPFAPEVSAAPTVGTLVVAFARGVRQLHERGVQLVSISPPSEQNLLTYDFSCTTEKAARLTLSSFLREEDSPVVRCSQDQQFISVTVSVIEPPLVSPPLPQAAAPSSSPPPPGSSSAPERPMIHPAWSNRLPAIASSPPQGPFRAPPPPAPPPQAPPPAASSSAPPQPQQGPWQTPRATELLNNMFSAASQSTAPLTAPPASSPSPFINVPNTFSKAGQHESLRDPGGSSDQQAAAAPTTASSAGGAASGAAAPPSTSPPSASAPSPVATDSGRFTSAADEVAAANAPPAPAPLAATSAPDASVAAAANSGTAATAAAAAVASAAAGATTPPAPPPPVVTLAPTANTLVAGAASVADSATAAAAAVDAAADALAPPAPTTPVVAHTPTTDTLVAVSAATAIVAAAAAATVSTTAPLALTSSFAANASDIAADSTTAVPPPTASADATAATNVVGSAPSKGTAKPPDGDTPEEEVVDARVHLPAADEGASDGAPDGTGSHSSTSVLSPISKSKPGGASNPFDITMEGSPVHSEVIAAGLHLLSIPSCRALVLSERYSSKWPSVTALAALVALESEEIDATRHIATLADIVARGTEKRGSPTADAFARIIRHLPSEFRDNLAEPFFVTIDSNAEKRILLPPDRVLDATKVTSATSVIDVLASYLIVVANPSSLGSFRILNAPSSFTMSFSAPSLLDTPLSTSVNEIRLAANSIQGTRRNLARNGRNFSLSLACAVIVGSPSKPGPPATLTRNPSPTEEAVYIYRHENGNHACSLSAPEAAVFLKGKLVTDVTYVIDATETL